MIKVYDCELEVDFFCDEDMLSYLNCEDKEEENINNFLWDVLKNWRKGEQLNFCIY